MGKRMKITKEIRKEIQTWINALRSGEFDQVQEALQTEYGFCCLGVACKVFIPKPHLKLQDELDQESPMEGGTPDEQEHAPRWLKNIDDDFHARTGVHLTSLNDDGLQVDIDEEEYEASDMVGGNYVRDAYGDRTGKVTVTEQTTFDEIADMLQLVYIEGVRT